MSLLLVEGGTLWSGTEEGVQSVLAAGGKILRVGAIRRNSVDSLGAPYDHINAAGCLVMPGLIDVHEHLIGGSGEEGFATQTPEITLTELLRGGITTVGGCLGVDTITRTMPALLAKAKALNEEGLTAFIWSGGYDVPPTTLTGSVRRDLLYIQEVIGAGEIAIADHRSSAPDLHDLARLVKEAHTGGMLSRKAGVTHFHVGEEGRKLADLRDLLDNYGVQPEWIYPTHCERTESLMREAIELTRRGVAVDVDVVERDLAKWVRFFLDQNGDPDRLTASSDAAIISPQTLFEQVRSCVLDHGLPRDVTLRLVTSNPARVLGLHNKGRLEPGCDADILVLEERSMEVRHLVSRGKVLVRDGAPAVKEAYLAGSNRRIELHGNN